MIVREAVIPDDTDGILAGMADFIERAELADFGVTIDTAVQGLIRIMDTGLFELWVVEDDGEIVGGIGLLFVPSPWNPAQTVMVEQFIWAVPGGPGVTFLLLIRQAERRSQERGAHLRQYVNLRTSPPKIEAVYRRLGLRLTEQSWVG